MDNTHGMKSASTSKEYSISRSIQQQVSVYYLEKILFFPNLNNLVTKIFSIACKHYLNYYHQFIPNQASSYVLGPVDMNYNKSPDSDLNGLFFICRLTSFLWSDPLLEQTMDRTTTKK